MCTVSLGGVAIDALQRPVGCAWNPRDRRAGWLGVGASLMGGFAISAGIRGEGVRERTVWHVLRIFAVFR